MDKDKNTPEANLPDSKPSPAPSNPGKGSGFQLPESHTAHNDIGQPSKKPSRVAVDPLDTPVHQAASAQPKTAKRPGKLKAWMKQHKLASAVIVILLLTAVGGGVALAMRKKPQELPKAGTESPTPTPTPVPTKKAAALTGVEVDIAVADQPVFASIVENLYGTGNARPQSGLSTAGVVYEALSEGGITRYLAVWQTDIPSDIGPVRSLRPIFYDSAMEYSAPVGHAGGSTDGLALASNAAFRDLDYSLGGAYRRINTRYAPHNLFILGPELLKFAASKGWNQAPTFTPWARKDDAPSTTPNATSITVDFSTAEYRAGFTYDAASNSYLRSVAGKPDLDNAASLKQVQPKTVIIVYAPVTPGVQPNGKPKTDIDITGTGKGLIFQDGVATTMTWTKSGSTSRMKFTDAEGKEIALNRGQSWVSYVPATLPVSYK